MGSTMAMLVACASPRSEAPVAPTLSTSLAEIEELWGRSLVLEKEQQRHLRFTLSPQQVPTGLTLKVVLRDQLGRDWLFKVGQEAADGAPAIAELARLVGVETPLAVRRTLNLNGTTQQGVIQPFVPNLGGFGNAANVYKFPPENLTDQAWTDLVRNHGLAWLGLNHHTHPDQFLLLGEPTRVERVIRIDNAVAWHLMGQDSFTVDFICPDLAQKMPAKGLGYAWLWRRLLRGDLNLDLLDAATWAIWVSELPSSLIKGIYQRGVENDFERFYNVSSQEISAIVPEHFELGSKEDFLNRLAARQASFGETAIPFYENMARKVDRPFSSPTPEQVVRSAQRHVAYLEALVADLSETQAQLSQQPPPQASDGVDAVLSVDAHWILRGILSGIHEQTPEEQTAALIKAHGDLGLLHAETDHPLERQAISAALALVGEMQGRYHSREELIKNRYHMVEVFPILPGTGTPSSP